MNVHIDIYIYFFRCFLLIFCHRVFVCCLHWNECRYNLVSPVIQFVFKVCSMNFVRVHRWLRMNSALRHSMAYTVNERVVFAHELFAYWNQFLLNDSTWARCKFSDSPYLCQRITSDMIQIVPKWPSLYSLELMSILFFYWVFFFSFFFFNLSVLLAQFNVVHCILMFLICMAFMCLFISSLPFPGYWKIRDLSYEFNNVHFLCCNKKWMRAVMLMVKRNHLCVIKHSSTHHILTHMLSE